MSIQINGEKYYRTAEACEKAGISRATLFRWLKKGTFKDDLTKDRRNWRLFTEEDILRLKSEANKINKVPSQNKLKFGNE
jgi:predicted site-specific integrase-resolvase